MGAYPLPLLEEREKRKLEEHGRVGGGVNGRSRDGDSKPSDDGGDWKATSHRSCGELGHGSLGELGLPTNFKDQTIGFGPN